MKLPVRVPSKLTTFEPLILIPSPAERVSCFDDNSVFNKLPVTNPKSVEDADVANTTEISSLISIPLPVSSIDNCSEEPFVSLAL